MVSDLLLEISQRTGQTLEQMISDAERPEPGKLAEVPDSPELARILALPRRQVGAGEHLAQPLTQALRLETGAQALRPIQALALAEMIEYGGAFLPIVAGAGKTLISYLAPAVLGAKRPLLLVPAALRKKTRDEFKILAQHWDGPHPSTYRIESYELLGRPQSGRVYASDGTTLLRQDYLDQIKPDLLVMDEVHKVKDQRTAVCKRVRRYLKQNPGVRVVAMSGTMTAKSIKDYAHVVAWCLPKTCPLPTKYREVEAWAQCLDDRVNGDRIRPGALRQLCTPEDLELPELEGTRLGYSRRLNETPGVVATQDGALEIPLILHALDIGAGDPTVDPMFEALRRDWVTPDGWELMDGIAAWRCARELALGFHYVWDPRPPEEWTIPRSAWAKWCREVLKNNRRGWDSEKQVKDAVDSGILADGGVLAAWRAVAPTFEPNTVAVWHSTEALDLASGWLSDHGGIVWTEHTAFARKLAKYAGVPYHGRQGLTDKGVPIERASGPIVASIASSGTGRNLQAWSKNLIISLPQSALTLEQLLARTHRPGQLAPQVETWIYFGCREHVVGLGLATEGAKYQKATLRSDQRLLYAERSSIVRESDITSRPGWRWK